jgi:hypothetical protein
MNRVTQVLVVIGSFAVVGIVGLGALQVDKLNAARRPKLSPVPLVSLPSPGPDGWEVTLHDAVLSMVRGPIGGHATVARITVCRDAYAVSADGSLTDGLKTDAATIAFGLMRRADLGTVLTPHEATFAGLTGYFLDVSIPKVSEFGGVSDLWLARAAQANCVVVMDTSDEDSGVGASQVGVPGIVRLGLFSEPDGTNVMVMITSEGIGARSKPDASDIDEATNTVLPTLTLNTPRPTPTATPSPRP